MTNWFTKISGDDPVRFWGPWRSCGIFYSQLSIQILQNTTHNSKYTSPQHLMEGGWSSLFFARFSIWSWRTKENEENHEDYSLLPTTYKIWGEKVKNLQPST
jgi:hypothetical protein